MQDEDHLFRLLFESSHEPTLIARPDKIIAGNQRALATFNCQNQEMLIGHPLAHFAATPAASLLQTMFGEAQAGQSAQFSWRARCAQGKASPSASPSPACPSRTISSSALTCSRNP